VRSKEEHIAQQRGSWRAQGLTGKGGKIRGMGGRLDILSDSCRYYREMGKTFPEPQRFTDKKALVSER